jgi:hypothetical protein
MDMVTDMVTDMEMHNIKEHNVIFSIFKSNVREFGHS